MSPSERPARLPPRGIMRTRAQSSIKTREMQFDSSLPRYMTAWLEEHELDTRNGKPWKGTGYRWELETCPFNPYHDHGEAWVALMPTGQRRCGPSPQLRSSPGLRPTTTAGRPSAPGNRRTVAALFPQQSAISACESARLGDYLPSERCNSTVRYPAIKELARRNVKS
jgi:hypothetical protein